MKQKERMNRIIARGEHSNHCHVITGNAEIEGDSITVLDDTAKIRHILETNWLNGEEVWTKEHHDIDLLPGTYRFIPQTEYHPYADTIERVRD